MRSILFFILIILFTNSVAAQNYLKYSPLNVSSFFREFFSIKSPPKDEYETWHEYLERVKLPTIADNKKFYFEVPINTRYNPYDSVLTLYTGLFYNQETNKYQLLLDEKVKKIRTYVARNGFGNSVRVSEYEKSIYYLDSLTINKIKFEDNEIIDCMFGFEYEGTRIFSIESFLILPPKAAKKIDKKLKAIVETKISSYFDRNTDSEYTEPEFSSPLEITEKTYNIDASISKIYIYDSSSKKILSIIEVL